MSEWKLPKPDPGPEYNFQPIVRVARTVPFGYEPDLTDPDILLPIEKELIALEKAKKLLKEDSYREVANWLSKETGRSISYEGLRKRVKIESKRKRSASIAKFYAEKYKKAMEKAAKIEGKVGGANPLES